ncbi:hypothetical protein AB0395_41165 [Streptosporangium sp. NPDC051023]|uniref:hypothetical protein n=1 Tax=Streptosporangium sp. NPDC051023 TaxID=3155410 RepID=UPI00344B1511
MISSSPFPDDYMVRLRAVELELKQIRTSLNSRPAFNRVESGPLVVGRTGSRQITLNPDGATNPEIWLDPDGSGTNPTRVVAEAGSGEAILKLYSGTSGGDQSTLTLASDEVSMESGGGSFAFWGADEARFGFGGNYFRFGQNICRHFGQWDDFASLPSNAGLLWGSVTLGGSFTGATVFYPASMDSNMGPIVGLRSGTGASMAWCITASNTSNFEIRWQTATSVAIYLCSFRH